MLKCLASRRLVELYVVAFGVLEGRHAAPGVLGDTGGNLDALALKIIYGLFQAGFGLEGHDGTAFDTGPCGFASVEADGEAVGINLGPIPVLVREREPQGVPVETFCPFYVLHGHPDHCYAFEHSLPPSMALVMVRLQVIPLRAVSKLTERMEKAVDDLLLDFGEGDVAVEFSAQARYAELSYAARCDAIEPAQVCLHVQGEAVGGDPTRGELHADGGDLVLPHPYARIFRMVPALQPVV